MMQIKKKVGRQTATLQGVTHHPGFSAHLEWYLPLDQPAGVGGRMVEEGEVGVSVDHRLTAAKVGRSLPCGQSACAGSVRVAHLECSESLQDQSLCSSPSTAHHVEVWRHESRPARLSACGGVDALEQTWR